MPTERELEVAAQLEDLAVLTKLIVQNIREGCEDSYGQVYALRARLGREVAKLGAGPPKNLNKIQDDFSAWLDV